MSNLVNKKNITSAVKVDSTLSKGLKILETLAWSDVAKGVTELSIELEMTKSNAYRLLRSLQIMGYVQQTNGKSYSPTMKAWQVGQKILENLDLPGLLSVQMKELSIKTEETIYLAVREGFNINYVDKIDSLKSVRTWSAKGASAPIHCVGPGKAILAAQYDVLREHMQDHLVKFTDNTITSLERLDEDVALTLKRGYSVDCAEYREHTYSFGSVIKGPNGEVIAAFGVSAPEVNLDSKRKEEIGIAVRDAGREASKAIQ